MCHNVNLGLTTKSKATLKGTNKIQEIGLKHWGNEKEAL